MSDLQNLKLLTLKQVKDLTSFPTSTLYDHMRDGRFPRPLKVGPHGVRWREHDVREWLANLQPANTDKDLVTPIRRRSRR